jgi:RNA polymerase sigma-70 factor (ECF subfamily)
MLFTPDEEAQLVVRSEQDQIVALATAASHGDEPAFVELYGVFSQRVFNLVLRSVHDRGMAEDLCQEIWLKVHREIGGLRTPDAIRSWLYRIATRACIDFARSSRAAKASCEELLDEVTQACDPMPEDAAIRDSQVRMVWETLATMAPRQGIALYLKQVDGRSYDEIAEVLNCTRETVESLLFRARQSFLRAYDRVQSSPAERCSLFQQVVAGIVDNEPTLLQKSAIHAHLQECRACREQLPAIAAAAKGYSLLPLLPLTKGLVIQTLTGGAAATTAIVAPAATGGVVAGLSLKAKLAALLGLLAMGTTGAATTGVVNMPQVPDLGAIVRPDDSRDGGSQVLTEGGESETTTQQGVSISPDAAAKETEPGASPASAGRRDTSAPGSDDDIGDRSAGGGSPMPPAAPPSGTGAAGDAGPEGTSGPGLTPPENPLGTLLGEPVEELDELTGGVVGGALGALDGTLEGVDGALNGVAGLADDTLAGLGETVDETLEPLDPVLDGLLPGEELDDVVDDTLDTLLPPENGDPGPVEGVLDGVDDIVDDILPGEEGDSGPLGGVLDPLLPPAATQPPASTPEPEATEPPEPPCLLGILC